MHDQNAPQEPPASLPEPSPVPPPPSLPAAAAAPLEPAAHASPPPQGASGAVKPAQLAIQGAPHLEAPIKRVELGPTPPPPIVPPPVAPPPPVAVPVAAPIAGGATAALEHSRFGAAVPLPPTAAELPRESKRVLAGVMAILFGFIGLHKFILGYTGPGIVLLLVTFIGGACTAGVSILATITIGFIEGVVYLSKSDAEFVRDYQIGRKEWF